MNKEEPTREQLFDEELDSVFVELDDSWRHGCRVCEVFHRVSDDTFWEVNYDRSSDGETNGLRQGDYSIVQVTPFETKTITYKRFDEQKKGE